MLTGLNPWLVAGHFLLSMVLVALSTALVRGSRDDVSGPGELLVHPIARRRRDRHELSSARSSSCSAPSSPARARTRATPTPRPAPASTPASCRGCTPTSSCSSPGSSSRPSSPCSSRPGPTSRGAPGGSSLAVTLAQGCHRLRAVLHRPAGGPRPAPHARCEPARGRPHVGRARDASPPRLTAAEPDRRLSVMRVRDRRAARHRGRRPAAAAVDAGRRRDHPAAARRRDRPLVRRRGRAPHERAPRGVGRADPRRVVGLPRRRRPSSSSGAASRPAPSTCAVAPTASGCCRGSRMRPTAVRGRPPGPCASSSTGPSPSSAYAASRPRSTRSTGPRCARPSRAGLRREGLLRGNTTLAGEVHDTVLLGRLVDDPAPGTREGFTAMLDSVLPTKRVIAQGLIRDGSRTRPALRAGLQARLGPARRRRRPRRATARVRRTRDPRGARPRRHRGPAARDELARRRGSAGATRCSSSTRSASPSPERAVTDAPARARDPRRALGLGHGASPAGSRPTTSGCSPASGRRRRARGRSSSPTASRPLRPRHAGAGPASARPGRGRCQIGSSATPTKRIVR